MKLAKKNKIKNLMNYETFEEVKDEGQEEIRSHWVVTQKEKHDGQKQPYKAGLIGCGFQEDLKPQSDSPTASKKSFKLQPLVTSSWPE